MKNIFVIMTVNGELFHQEKISIENIKEHKEKKTLENRSEYSINNDKLDISISEGGVFIAASSCTLNSDDEIDVCLCANPGSQKSYLYTDNMKTFLSSSTLLPDVTTVSFFSSSPRNIKNLITENLQSHLEKDVVRAKKGIKFIVDVSDKLDHLFESDDLNESMKIEPHLRNNGSIGGVINSFDQTAGVFFNAAALATKAESQGGSVNSYENVISSLAKKIANPKLIDSEIEWGGIVDRGGLDGFKNFLTEANKSFKMTDGKKVDASSDSTQTDVPKIRFSDSVSVKKTKSKSR